MKRESYYYRGHRNNIIYCAQWQSFILQTCLTREIKRRLEYGKGRAPRIKWSVMDRTRQLQIVPFSSEFLGSHAILGCDVGSKVKLLQTTWHALEEKNVLAENDWSLNILRDIITKICHLLCLILLRKKYINLKNHVTVKWSFIITQFKSVKKFNILNC